MSSTEFFNKLKMDMWYSYTDIPQAIFNQVFNIIDRPALRIGIDIVENDSGQFMKVTAKYKRL